MPDPEVHEPVVVEAAELDEREAELAFASGYEGSATTPTETSPPVDVATTSAEHTNPSTEDSRVSDAVSTTPISEPSVSLPESQLRDLLTKVNSVDEIRAAIEKLRGDAFGKVGGLERTLKQLQEATPAGQAIEVSASDLAELESEFPGLNLGPSLAKGLTRVLSKFKGTGAPVVGITPEELQAHLNVRAQQDAEFREEERKRQAAERLTDLHEDWQHVIGPVNSQTEFRTWLKGQGAEQETAFLSSWDPRFIAKTLTKFKSAKQAPPIVPKPATSGKDPRTQRLAEAVPAKGGGMAPAKSKVNEEELAFEAGYSGK